MNLQCLFVSGRSAALMIEDGGLYETLKPYRLVLSGEERGTVSRVITSVYGLWPDTDYTAEVYDGQTLVGSVSFRTRTESYTLNVRRFGAVGDGVHDDTTAIQTAITCCPAENMPWK